MKKGKIKSQFIKWHRQMGLWLSVIMLVWFISGIVMLFYGFPHFTRKERNNSLTKIKAENFVAYKATAEPLLKNSKTIYFYNFLGKPVLEKKASGKSTQKYFLDTGKEIKNVDSVFAYNVATATFNLQNEKYELEIINSLDTWIPWERMTKHFPIYKFYFEDSLGTQIYVSHKTGEILQHSTSKERFWAYFGAIPHWIYFKDLRRHVETWRWLIIVLSFFGSVMSLAGIITGILRLKKRHKSKVGFSPYKNKLYRWHHYTGFVFGFLVFTWVFSGMMSLVPANWFYNEKPEGKIIDKWESSFTDLQPLEYDSLFSKLNEADFDIKEIEVTAFDDKNIVIYKNTTLKSLLFSKRKLIKRKNEKLLAQKENLIKAKFNGDLESIELLTSYDNYYYSKYMLRTLPLLKVYISNNIGTVIYIDPLTNRIAKVTNKFSRIRRWLYRGLHILDFPVLYTSSIRLPLMIVLMLGGTIVALTGTLFLIRKTTKKMKK